MKSFVSRTLLGLVVVAVVALGASGATPRRASAQVAQPATSQASQPPAAQNRPPVFAYLYIGFDPTSWQRAKRDYPLRARYSRHQRLVLAQQVPWANAPGTT